MPAVHDAIPEELARFLETGVSTLVGTRNAAMRPTASRAVGAQVSADRRSLTVCIPQATGARALVDLRECDRVAVTFSRPRDHRTVQIKGRVERTYPTPEAERERLRAYKDAFVEELHIVGMSRQVTGRLAYWPCTTLVVTVESLFDQTPGPNAGKILGAAR